MARVIHIFRTPDRFVAGTVGEPGDRSFYLQAREDTRTVSVLLEKEQVAVLAERLAALLDEVARRFGGGAGDDPADPSDPSEAEDDDDPVAVVTAAVAATQDEEIDTEPLTAPVEQEFRVGTMGLGWDAESQAVVVELLAVSEEEIDESVVLDDTDEGPDAVRVFLSPDQARAFTTRAERVVSAGRKPCPLCAEPLEPGGHVCPRQNGYRRTSTDDPDAA